ncbi:MAG TPA: hypothetical protein VGE12_12590 [Noviherbaspirillum sp.]
MKLSFRIAGLRFFAAATLAAIAPFSMAGSDVSWSISVGTPYPAPQVVAPPPVVYVQPQPVYVRPRPVYVQPATVVQYGPTYYVEEVRPKKMKHRHWKHRHHHRHYDY